MNAPENGPNVKSLPRLTARGTMFVDETGRQTVLRGVNLGGDSKVPYPHGGTNFPSDFFDHRDVSFVGRPFPLEEARSHFRRIAGWGFNCLRLLTTWEAVEHAGPGRYDSAYLDYFAELVRLAGEAGLYVFIDFHQDAWSRMTGGDGAPGWVFDALGLDFTRFPDVGAAHVMQAEYDYSDPRPSQEAYGQMSWSKNYSLPANGIMWSLFWAGSLITPAFRIGGRNVQEFLQGHLLGAVSEVAKRLRDMPHVIGFDTLNEPGTGWIGQSLSYRHLARTPQQPAALKPGPVWSPLDALAAARGLRVTLPVLGAGPDGSENVVVGSTTVDPQGRSLWLRACPFEEAGAYDIRNGVAVARDEGFFARAGDKPLSISEDCYGPFFRRMAETVRSHRPGWLLFAEVDPYGLLLGRGFPANMPEGWVNASHWYDVYVLYRKTYDVTRSGDIQTGQPDVDERGLRARYLRQLGYCKAQSEARGVPALIGEFGIPFDLDEGRSYRAWDGGERGDDVWRTQVKLLAYMYDALDALLLSATQWNYTASNRNDPRIGDGWNQEDFSIFSHDQLSPTTDGGRAVDGFCRPFVRHAQGHIVSMSFERETWRFSAEIAADPAIDAGTEIYLPPWEAASDYHVVCSDAAATIVREGSVVTVRASAKARIRIEITRL